MSTTYFKVTKSTANLAGKIPSWEQTSEEVGLSVEISSPP